jgi:hypothetical protein
MLPISTLKALILYVGAMVAQWDYNSVCRHTDGLSCNRMLQGQKPAIRMCNRWLQYRVVPHAHGIIIVWLYNRINTVGDYS